MPRKTIKLASSPTETGNNSTTIGFRLDAEALSVLAQRAALSKESVHSHARTLVLRAMSDEEGAALQQGILQLNDEVRQLRGDMVFIFRNLLITAGKLSEADATEWIKRNFKH